MNCGHLLKDNTLINSMDDLVFIVDDDGNVVKSNKAVRNLFGKNINKKCWEMMHGENERIDECPAHVTMKTGKASQKEFHYNNFAGCGEAWMDIHTYPISEGEDKYAIHIVRDITDKKIYEYEIQKANAILLQIAETINWILKNNADDEEINYILKKICDIADIDISALYEIRENNGEYYYHQTNKCFKDCVRDDFIDEGKRVETIQCYNNQKEFLLFKNNTHFIIDQRNEKLCPFGEILKDYSIFSSIMFPVTNIDDTIYGFLMFGSCLEDKEWSEIEISILKAISSLIGTVLNKIQEQEKIVNVIDKAISSQNQMSESLDNIIENMGKFE